MNSYAFIPGTHPALSLAELRALNIGTFTLVTKGYFVVETSAPLDTVSLQFRLGGTVKIVEIMEIVEPSQLEKVFDINHLLSQYFAQSEEKIIFGISVYGHPAKSLFVKLRRQGFTAKKKLSESEYSSRFLFDPSGILANAAVVKNNLVQRGAEIIFLVDDEKLYVGKTATVQDFESYSARDYGRPVRDTRSGTLPPKLAQIMINLAGQPTSAIVLDPFCGSGTILQEALRMGYTDVIGSDISTKATADTEKNVAWFTKSEGITRTPRIIHADAAELDRHLAPSSVDVLVTEPHLGPPLSRPPDHIKLSSILTELRKLYQRTFPVLAGILKPGGTAVIVLPVFRVTGGPAQIDLGAVFTKTSLHPQAVLLEEDYARLGFTTGKKSLIYSRPDQVVGRELFVLVKKR